MECAAERAQSFGLVRYFIREYNVISHASEDEKEDITGMEKVKSVNGRTDGRIHA